MTFVSVRDHPAFEILTPYTARNDRGRKRQLMARYGVPEYWILDLQAKTVELSRSTESGYDQPFVLSEGRRVVCCCRLRNRSSRSVRFPPQQT